MTARIIALAEALKDELEDQFDREVLRRYTPYLGRAQFADERITVFPSAGETEVTSRSFDDSTFTIGIEVAQALPESGDQSRTNPDADINQVKFLDERMQTVESVKDLFRDEGPLREELIGECYFASMANEPIYNLGRLVEDRIFSSVIRLTFTYTGSD